MRSLLRKSVIFFEDISTSRAMVLGRFEILAAGRPIRRRHQRPAPHRRPLGCGSPRTRSQELEKADPTGGSVVSFNQQRPSPGAYFAGRRDEAARTRCRMKMLAAADQNVFGPAPARRERVASKFGCVKVRDWCKHQHLHQSGHQALTARRALGGLPRRVTANEP